MDMHKLKLGITFLAACVLSSGASALVITDPGVVGTIWTGTASADETNVTLFGQYLLDLGASAGPVAGDANTDGTDETYTTSSVDYNGTLTLADATRINSATPDITGFEWVIGKYDGQNAGFVMFNVADFLAANVGATTIPEFSYSIWGDKAGQYQLSNITGFGGNGNGVPEPGVLGLLGIGMLGIVLGRRRMAA